ncbi:MAG TPA: amidohydrolase family protein [Stellaceae bacterium]|jgi:predicted TIM-barrel fold metal-dependent hydrolase|nr:amidohydrolase family protein [Stellaceae bacterium]
MAENVEPRRPRFVLPAGATDCHFHVYENDPRFPAHKMDTALAVHRRLGIDRGILVQALPESRAITLQGLALAGPNYRAITPILDVPSEKELAALHEAGFRGVRFAFTARGRHGRPPDVAIMRATVARIAPLGWHTDFFLGGAQDLMDMSDFLRSLPVPFVIDAMGRIDVAGGLEQPAFRALLDLVRHDHGWVKLAGSDRLSKAGPPFHDALPFARALAAAAPDRVIWGTDWPHPNNPYDPDDADLVDLVPLIAPDEIQRRKLLVDNPARLVGFAP